MSNFVETNCPSCGADISVPKNETSTKCNYCSATVVVQEAIQKSSGKKIENIKMMAQTAYEGENYEEAYNYYNQVLEIDNTDADSWFGKGYTAVWQSTLADDKTKEMIPAFKMALANTPDDEIDPMVKKIAHSGREALLIIAGMQRNHVNQFGSTWDPTFDTDVYDAEVCGAYVIAIDKYLGLAIELGEICGHEKASEMPIEADMCYLELASFVYEKIQVGSLITKKNLFNSSAATFSNSYDTTIMDGLIDIFMDRAKSRNSEEFPPDSISDPRKGGSSGGGGCFIATASLMDESHPDLLVLRSFRDNSLSTSYLGKAFIDWYYRNGPTMAKHVKTSELLKALVKTIVVKPMVLVVKVFKIG